MIKNILRYFRKNKTFINNGTMPAYCAYCGGGFPHGEVGIRVAQYGSRQKVVHTNCYEKYKKTFKK